MDGYPTIPLTTIPETALAVERRRELARAPLAIERRPPQRGRARCAACKRPGSTGWPHGPQRGQEDVFVCATCRGAGAGRRAEGGR